MQERSRSATLCAIAVALLLLTGSRGIPAAGAGEAEFDLIAREAVGGFKRIVSRLDPAGESKSADSATLAWDESGILLAYVSYAESTGDRTFLVRAMEHIDRVLANRDDRHKRRDMIRNRILPAWSTSRYTGGKRYTWIMHVGLITYPIARWVYLVKSDPVLFKQYGRKALVYEKELAKTLDAFDDDWRKGERNGEGYYWCRAVGVPQPMAYLAAIGRTLLTMYLNTGEKKYLNLTRAAAIYFKNRLRDPLVAYVWSHDPGKRPAEDIVHGGICVDFAVECHRAGIVFSAKDMEKFALTFKQMNRGGKGFTRLVTGKGSPSLNNSAAAGGWVRLGWFDTEVRRIFYKAARAKWKRRSRPFLLGTAYLIETARPFERRKPIKSRRP